MSNKAWRLNSRYGVAYLEDRRLVEEILRLEGSTSKAGNAVMATYLSPAGKAFAWQVRFTMDKWDAVSQALGPEADTKERSAAWKESKAKAAPRSSTTARRPSAAQGTRSKRS